MTFLEKFEQICAVRGETPSHALRAAGMNPSCYPKWKKAPERTPYGTTIQTLANYFRCPAWMLEPSVQEMSETQASLMYVLSLLSESDQKHALSYFLFTYRKDLPDEVQTLQERYS